ncbi:MAG: extracellular solute-binding protein [Lachnospiraceae bacterium]|jgi:ABC-type glycerol-3-phosphate transport system substrate-binding protein|nr:extracellular solute-binding protein [Lachnospiraceae bacterium]
MKKQFSFTTLMMLAAVTLLITSACKSGTKEESQDPQNTLVAEIDTGIVYVSDTIDIPHDSIWAEAIYKNILYYVADDGGKMFICRIDLNDPETVWVMPIAIGAEEIILRAAVDENDIVHLLVNQYNDDNHAKHINTAWRRFAADGTVLDILTVGEFFIGAEFHFVTGFEISTSGNAHISVNNDIYVINPDGELVYQVTCGGPVIGLFRDYTGKTYAHWRRENSYLMAMIDEDSRGLAASYDITAAGSLLGGGSNSQGTFFLFTDRTAYSFDTEEFTLTEIFNWFDIGIITGHANSGFHLDDDRFLWVGRSSIMTNDAVSFRVVRPRTEEEAILAAERAAAQDGQPELVVNGLPMKEGNIVLGVAYLGGSTDIMKAVLDFNQANPNTQIEVRDYGGNDDAAFNMNLDIIRGNAPDVIMMNSRLPYHAYVHMGLLIDLYPLLEEEDFEWGDYYENIIRAYEYDGILPAVPISFFASAMSGKMSDLSYLGKNEWTMAEFIDFADRYPESNLFWIPTKPFVLDILLTANGEHIVDWTGENYFNRSLFIEMIEFANRFHDEDKYEVNWLMTDLPDRVADGDLRLWAGIATFSDIQWKVERFGEPILNIGYPSEEGSGFLAYANHLLAISKNSENVGTAWRFISFLLSDERQSEMDVPIRRSSREAEMDWYKEFWMNNIESLGLESWFFESIDEEFAKIKEIFDTVYKIKVIDMQINNIILEEVGAYFYGNKTAAEVADVVENRIGIYVKEQR